MKRWTLLIVAGGGLVTLCVLGVWIATGRHYYTKFEVVERVKSTVDPDDPFAGTGLYDNEEAQVWTVKRDEFHLGLLPTPQRLFDKHAVSVLSILVPLWTICFVVLWWLRRRCPSERMVKPTSLPKPKS